MTSQKICSLANIATKALDKSVASIVSVAALEQYTAVVEFINCKIGINVNDFFAYIALLAVLCWVGQWLEEIINFICKTVPKFFKNLMCGKLSLCLLDCDKSCKSSKSSKSSKSCKYSKYSKSSKSSKSSEYCSTKY